MKSLAFSKQMKKRQKKFPWLKSFLRKLLKSFSDVTNTNLWQDLLMNIENELSVQSSCQGKKRNLLLFEVIKDLFLHFWWKLNWSSKKNWKKYWKKVSFNTCPESEHTKCFSRLLYNLVFLGIVLSEGSPDSPSINQVLQVISILPSFNELLYDSLLQISSLNRKYQPAYVALLKHILCREADDGITKPLVYLKIIVLFKRLKRFTVDKSAKSDLTYIASRIHPPSDTITWLSSFDIDIAVTNENDIAPTLLRQKYSSDIFQKISVIVSQGQPTINKNKEHASQSKKNHKSPDAEIERMKLDDDTKGLSQLQLVSCDETDLGKSTKLKSRRKKLSKEVDLVTSVLKSPERINTKIENGKDAGVKKNDSQKCLLISDIEKHSNTKNGIIDNEKYIVPNSLLLNQSQTKKKSKKSKEKSNEGVNKNSSLFATIKKKNKSKKSKKKSKEVHQSEEKSSKEKKLSKSQNKNGEKSKKTKVFEKTDLNHLLNSALAKIITSPKEDYVHMHNKNATCNCSNNSIFATPQRQHLENTICTPKSASKRIKFSLDLFTKQSSLEMGLPDSNKSFEFVDSNSGSIQPNSDSMSIKNNSDVDLYNSVSHDSKGVHLENENDALLSIPLNEENLSHYEVPNCNTLDKTEDDIFNKPINLSLDKSESNVASTTDLPENDQNPLIKYSLDCEFDRELNVKQFPEKVTKNDNVSESTTCIKNVKWTSLLKPASLTDFATHQAETDMKQIGNQELCETGNSEPFQSHYPISNSRSFSDKLTSNFIQPFETLDESKSVSNQIENEKTNKIFKETEIYNQVTQTQINETDADVMSNCRQSSKFLEQTKNVSIQTENEKTNTSIFFPTTTGVSSLLPISLQGIGDGHSLEEICFTPSVSLINNVNNNSKSQRLCSDISLNKYDKPLNHVINCDITNGNESNSYPEDNAENVSSINVVINISRRKSGNDTKKNQTKCFPSIESAANSNVFCNQSGPSLGISTFGQQHISAEEKIFGNLGEKPNMIHSNASSNIFLNNPQQSERSMPHLLPYFQEYSVSNKTRCLIETPPSSHVMSNSNSPQDFVQNVQSISTATMNSLSAVKSIASMFKTSPLTSTPIALQKRNSDFLTPNTSDCEDISEWVTQNIDLNKSLSILAPLQGSPVENVLKRLSSPRQNMSNAISDISLSQHSQCSNSPLLKPSSLFSSVDNSTRRDSFRSTAEIYSELSCDELSDSTLSLGKGDQSVNQFSEESDSDFGPSRTNPAKNKSKNCRRNFVNCSVLNLPCLKSKRGSLKNNKESNPAIFTESTSKNFVGKKIMEDWTSPEKSNHSYNLRSRKQRISPKLNCYYI